MDLLYLSHGNIPSRWAHTFQIMKMSEALNAAVGSFECVTSSDIRTSLRRPDDLWAMYGITAPFPLRRLPLWWRAPESCDRGVRSRRFDLAAVAYARLRRPRLALTRVREIALGCLRGRVPTLIEVHGRPSHAGLAEFRSLLRTPGLVGVVTVSDPLRELCMDLGADQRVVAVFPNGVDVERFRADMLPKAARRLIGVPDGKPIVVYAGHLYEHKGIATLFEAAATLSDVLFLVVGGWPDDVDRWRTSTHSLSNVLFTGFVPNEQIPRYLAAADLCVLPNSARDEEARWTSPLKLFEYMAAGRPIVASDLPVLRALLADGRNALLVRPDDPPALADGIQTVLDSPDLAARLARGARDDACRHSWGERARGILGHFAPHLLHIENQSPAHS